MSAHATYHWEFDTLHTFLIVPASEVLGILLLFHLRHETGHETIGDGGTNPYFSKHVVGIIANGLQVDIPVVECGYEYVNDADEPQVALGIVLPVLARIEIGAHKPFLSSKEAAALLGLSIPTIY